MRRNSSGVAAIYPRSMSDSLVLDPKPLVSFLDRFATDYADPFDHPSASPKFTVNPVSPALCSCRQQFGEAKLVPVRISNVKEPLAPCGIPGRFGF